MNKVLDCLDVFFVILCIPWLIAYTFIVIAATLAVEIPLIRYPVYFIFEEDINWVLLG